MCVWVFVCVVVVSLQLCLITRRGCTSAFCLLSDVYASHGLCVQLCNVCVCVGQSLQLEHSLHVNSDFPREVITETIAPAISHQCVM